MADAEKSHSIKSDDEVKESLLVADETTPAAAQATYESVNEYWMSKQTEVSTEFRENMGLALRGGFMCLVLGVPFMLGPDNNILPDFWNELRRKGLINTFAVVMFVFTLYKSVGETICFAWQGMIGTFFCSLTIWLMFQTCPGGVTLEAPAYHFWCGIGIGLAFTILMLGLNVSLLAQIFGLSNFAYFYMSFMLGHSDGFSSGWEINTKGAAVSMVMVSSIGVSLAIIASLIPWPILLIRKAKAGAEVLTSDTLNLWTRAVKVFLSEENQEYELDGMATSRSGLQARAGTLSYAIENAWWECLGMGPWQRSRAAMTTYHRYMIENHDRIPSVLFACTHNDQGKSHFDMMNPLKEQIDEVMAHTQLLYQKATVAAVAGGIATEEEYNSMMDTKTKTDESIITLTRAFQKTKSDLGLPMVNSDQMDEHCFCFNLCSHARIACGLADEFIEAWKKGGGFGGVECPGLFSVFDIGVICDPGHVSFTVRNSITLIACFIAGYAGFPPHTASLVKPGSGGPACTAAILMSTFRPSMVKNLDRLNGVVLGNIVGQLVYMSLGYCTWWGYLGICISLFVWVTGTLYMYYNSVKYGVVGCLLAAFGSQAFLQGCTNDFSNPAKTYYSIVECVVAIFIVIGVDALISNSRSSDLAYEAYEDFWKTFRGAVEGILDPNLHTQKSDHAALEAKVALCHKLNPEAIDEPRWWRTPWRKLAYADGVACATKLRLALNTMEDSIPGQDGEGSTEASSEAFDKMLALPSFGKIREGVSGKLEQLERFIKIFVHETEDAMEDLKNPSELRQWGVEVAAAIEEFMTESLAKNSFSPEEPSTLEDDDTCEISLFLSSLTEMMTAMREFQHSILRHA